MTDLTSGDDLRGSAALGRAVPAHATPAFAVSAGPASARRGDAPVRARMDGARQGMDYTPPVRTGAFGASARHTARVKLFKRAIVLGSLLAVVSVAIVVVFNPFRHLAGSVSLASVGVSGTKITMDLPKISGVQQGGGAYEVKAKSGIQDITAPSIMELLGVDARVGMADATTTHITSQHGLYNSRADTMSLSGDVEIANTSGYTLHLQSAVADFKGGRLISHERLTVDIEGGSVSADDLAISNNGHIINFTGGVSSTFASSDATPAEPSRAVVR